MDNCLELDYLLAEQGGVCVVINKTCCTYVNNSGRFETNTRKIYEQAEWLHKYNQQGQGIRGTLTSWLPSLTWLLPLLVSLITLLLLLLLGPCLFNLLVKFVSSRLKKLHIKLTNSRVSNQSPRVMLKPTNTQRLWWPQEVLFNLWIE